jgi:2-polyprenyl-6-methoxyphenol hydroxylase-like FAD-dependent oxidoreductase
MGPRILSPSVAIAGGGPAGMMLGLLLARAGIEVVVLEKHADFLRDFRGDTIHPSTLEVIHELGWLDELLARPHQEARELSGQVGGVAFTLADFGHLPTRCRFVAFMPQWELLDFMAEHARRYAGFQLIMQAEVTELIEEGGRVVGVRATTPDGPLEVRAPLTVGADGRGSTVRARSGLTVRDLGAPMDVLWMRLSRRPTDPAIPMGRLERGRVWVMIYRGDYWQCGFVIPKGEVDAIRARGLDALRAAIVEVAPFLRDRVGELRDWDDIHLLTVKVDRLERWWRWGLLCIGDAAHAMSPIGGVGINLAIQDAVATANLLVEPLRDRTLTPEDLDRVQSRREPPTRLTQRLQVYLQDRLVRPTLEARAAVRPPAVVRALARWPVLQRIPARVVGMGFRPEHVRV